MEPTNRVDLRARIADRLKSLGVTQRELARRMGVTPQEINNFLRGRQPISLSKLEEIFYILGM